MKHIAFAAFLGVILQVTAAFAQGQGGGSPVYQNWFPVGTPATLNVSNVTANVALPTGGLTARVCNTGATDAYVVLGTANTVVATTTAGSFLASGKCQPFNLLPFATRYTYIAAITASSTTTIRVESGLGSPIASDAAGASAHPSGPAGGDLAGTYPNPTVAQATMGTGGLLAWNSDTGLTRDSVLGAGNLDLGNGTANNKTGVLNMGAFSTSAVSDSAMNGSLFVGGTTRAASSVYIYRGTDNANVEVFNNGSFGWSNAANPGNSADTVISRHAAASVQLGFADAAAPVAQTFGPQSVVAGTSNTAAPTFTIRPSAGSGTGVAGNIVFQAAPHDVTHTVNTFTGSASPYTIGFTAGQITTYPIGTVMTVSGCTTATLNGTYTVTASSSGSVTATTSATGTGSPTTCVIVGNTSQNAYTTAMTINGDTANVTFGGAIVEQSATGNAFLGSICVGNTSCPNSTTYLSRSNGIAIASWGTGGIGWAPSTDPSAAPDTVFWRSASGVVDLGNSTTDNTAGSLKFASYIAGGTAPVPTGTCTRGTQTGGLTAGSIVLTCTAQTLILTFTTTAPTGWMCEAIDQTTVADTMKQTSNTTTSCTLTGTTAASDVVIYQARAY